MSDLLKTLQEQRDLILLAEIGALIHDLGKLSPEFIAFQAELSKQLSIDHHLILRRAMRGRYQLSFTACKNLEDEFRKRVQDWAKGLSDKGVPQETRNDAKNQIWQGLERFWENIPGRKERQVIREESLVPDDFLSVDLLELLDSLNLAFRWPAEDQHAMGDFIEAHHLPTLVTLGPAIKILMAKFEGCDGVDSAVDKGAAKNRQLLEKTLIATAFGHEPDCLRIKTDELKQVRHDYANNLAFILRRIQTERAKLPAGKALSLNFWQEVLYDGWETTDGRKIGGLRKLTETAFRKSLGETRRAANDVTLWDHSFSVASLYKAALAKILLEQAMNPDYHFPEVIDIHWRLLRVGYPGLSFLEQAHHVTDLLGRQAALEEALDDVKRALEVEFPLGNEIYRDENGSAFLAPALDQDNNKGDQIKNLVEDTVRKAFLKHLWGEIKPALFLSRASREATELGNLLSEPNPLLTEASTIEDCWQKQVGVEICSICGLRPQGYIEPDLPEFARDPEKAKARRLCGVCLARRGRRSQDWAQNKKGLLTRTIWIDEVADEHGRVALVVGRFGLENWLGESSYISSLFASPGSPKNPSFARLRRTWETTQHFWQEAETQILNEVLQHEEKRLELTLKPPNLPGKFHVYEARYSFGDLPVVWNSDKLKLITVSNLRTLGRSADNWTGKLQGPVTLYEPSGYGRPSVRAGNFQIVKVEASPTPYKPYIPLLAKPLVYMALVPGVQALQAACKIRDRYEEEIGKVRNRLPLALGLVFFDTRTPLRAILDAGRRFLQMPLGEEPWVVDHIDEEVDAAGYRWAVAHFKDYKPVWRVPISMGDKSEDHWYPYYFLKSEVDPSKHIRTFEYECKGKSKEGNEIKLWRRNLVHLADLQPGDQVGVTPALLDFVYLDVTGRRFEIAYQQGDSKPERLDPKECRKPYYLEQLDDLTELWELLRKSLTTKQTNDMLGLIETKRREWQGNSAVFDRFAEDTLKNSDWRGGWERIEGDKKQKLIQAAKSGMLDDVRKLYMEIMKKRPEAD